MVFAFAFRLLFLATLNVLTKKPWYDIIPEVFRLIFSLALFFINLLVIAGVLYVVGLIAIGRRQTRLADAFVISLVGTALSIAFFMFIPYTGLPLLLSIATWLILIKRLYATGWLGAITVGILAVAVFLAVTVILALIFGLFERVSELLFPQLISIL